MMKRPRLLLVLVLWALIPGCQIVQLFDPLAQSVKDEVDNSLAEVSNEACSEIAWRRWNDLFKEQPHRHDFATGFRAAYVDVINGGSGEPPVLPPRGYWRHCYRSAVGQEKANAWFLGYRYGAIAAEQEGVGNWYELPLNLHPEEMPPGDEGLPTVILESGPVPAPTPESLQEDFSEDDGDLNAMPSPEMVFPEAGNPALQAGPSQEEPPLPELAPTTPRQEQEDLGRIPFGPSESSKEP